MDQTNVRNNTANRFFQGISKTESNLLALVPLMKFRSYCFDKYITNLNESSLSDSEIKNFFTCYDSLRNLQTEWQK
jgi:hypothetical protein